MQKISPFLWFDHEAEEAAHFYVSVFRNSCIDRIARYPEGTPGKAGTVMTVGFTLNGQAFTALNGGPVYKPTPAISFVVQCDGQAELEEYWGKLTTDGGKPVQCGWLEDKYGISWQIVPARLLEMFLDKDTDRTRRVAEAMMKMVKLDLPALEKAFAGP
jgi:predicted 3-demethylubiquinone-9 3-methyltransferase (glyoxalase superfamily)